RRHSQRRRPGAGVGIVDLNRADARALGRVPGIGSAIAERIVAVREHEGAFASLDELLDVAGMSASRLDRARPHLEL
ncbi:MAG TPA: helix-hairpin-helix domain-containing protein, partial [Candidatus Tyrphobacter sp.]